MTNRQVIELADENMKRFDTRVKWDQRFMDLARFVAEWSKDSTKVGCIIVKDKSVVASGYNGICRGVSDDVPARFVRPEKLFWFEHAERNALYYAAKNGVSVNACTAYSTLCPCSDCARGFIQSGIEKVLTMKPDLEKFPQWAESFSKSEQMFNEAGVNLVLL